MAGICFEYRTLHCAFHFNRNNHVGWILEALQIKNTDSGFADAADNDAFLYLHSASKRWNAFPNVF